jgi:4-amino-4-deoxychorismate lyase
MCQYLETISILNGEPLHLPYHIRRVAENCSIDLQYYINTLQFPKTELQKLSIVYDSKNILNSTIAPYSIRNIFTFKLIHNNKIDYSKKFANRSELEAMVAQKGSCDEILIVKNGVITDTSFSNIVFKKGSHWITPKKPLLQGTCRARLIENGIIETGDLEISDLKQYSHFMLINAMLDFDEQRAYPIGKETFIL